MAKAKDVGVSDVLTVLRDYLYNMDIVINTFHEWYRSIIAPMCAIIHA
jgi:hypothetical protein